MYFANSIVYVARPWLIERMDVEYWNISASGTSAVTTLPEIGIFHADDLAAAAIQVADDVAVIVLRRHHLDLHDRLEDDGLRLRIASLNAMEPAILNAISFESTSWYEPSNSVIFTSTTG